MPDETRAEALEAMARDVSHEIYAMWTDAAVNIPGGLRRAMSERILAALRTVEQETARATWKRAIDFVQQLPRAEAIGVMSGMLDKTYRRTKPLSEIRELVACPRGRE